MAMFGQTGLILGLLLHTVLLLEDTWLAFRREDDGIEMGFCFAADYIVVFKSTTQGTLVVGNSSSGQPEDSPSSSVDLRRRVIISKHIPGLLGLEITSLVQSDSGYYTRECWENGVLGTEGIIHLTVCKEEIDPEEIVLLHGEGAHLLCNHSTISQGTSVRWYREVYPNNTRIMFLDSASSLEPLQKELLGHLKVRNNGTLLIVDNTILKYSLHFTCLVLDGEKCLSFQTKFFPEKQDSQEETVLRSAGEGVTLHCPSEHIDPELLLWETPLGNLDWIVSTTNTLQTHSKTSDPVDVMYQLKKSNYSLIIPSLTEGHSGVYKCLSPTIVKEYSLIICPKMDFINVTFSPTENVVLTCNPNQNESYNVQWYRRKSGQQDHLIVDTKHPSLTVPEELKGRVNLLPLNSSLSLVNLSMGDSGDYWCAVLQEVDYMDDENKLLEDAYTDQCVSAQTIRLVYSVEDISHGAETLFYAISIGLIGFVLLGVICAAVAIIVTRRRSSRKSRKPSGHEARGTEQGIEQIPCTEWLDPVKNST